MYFFVAIRPHTVPEQLLSGVRLAVDVHGVAYNTRSEAEEFVKDAAVRLKKMHIRLPNSDAENIVIVEAKSYEDARQRILDSLYVSAGPLPPPPQVPSNVVLIAGVIDSVDREIGQLDLKPSKQLLFQPIPVKKVLVTLQTEMKLNNGDTAKLDDALPGMIVIGLGERHSDGKIAGRTLTMLFSILGRKGK